MAIGRRHVGSVLAIAIAMALWSASSAGAYIYWVNYDSGTIGRADLNGSRPDQRFISGVKGAQQVAVDPRHIYWTNYDTGTIGRANLDGSNPKPRFITGTSHPYGLAVDSGHIYWTHGFDVGRAKLDGSSIETGFIAGVPGSSPYGLAIDGTHVYWTVNSTAGNWIGRANLDGGAANPTFLNTGGDPNRPQLVAVDAAHLFWTNNIAAGSFIGRANIDGSAANPNFRQTKGTAGSPAVNGGHLYWTTSGNRIARSALDVTGADYSFVTGLRNPHGLAVDALRTPTASCTLKKSGARTLITCTLKPASGHASPVRLRRNGTTVASGRLTASGRVVFTTRVRPPPGKYQLAFGRTTVGVRIK